MLVSYVSPRTKWNTFLTRSQKHNSSVPIIDIILSHRSLMKWSCVISVSGAQAPSACIQVVVFNLLNLLRSWTQGQCASNFGGNVFLGVTFQESVSTTRSNEGQCGTQMAGEVGVVLLSQLYGRESHRWRFFLRADIETRLLPVQYLECQLRMTTNTLASWIRMDQDGGWDKMLLEVLGWLVGPWWPLLKNRMRDKCIEGTNQGTVWIPCRN